MKLITNWEIFSNQLDELNTEAESLTHKRSSITTESQLEEVKSLIQDWDSKCLQFLKSSFDSERNDFATDFYNSEHNHFHIGPQRRNFEQLKKEAFDALKMKQKLLLYYKKILSVSDAIIKPELIEIANRQNFSTEETLELILDKLYLLYDNSYHSVSMILEGNGIELKRTGEDRELIKMLENHGYVNATHTRDSSAQLTLAGKLYIEEKRKTYKESYEDLNKSQEEINIKVNEVLEKLIKLGYGQEIIFDEIQELKELYSTLNKKNWGQVVKGKLLDLALAKLIENDTAKYIYETLTEHQLRLP